MNSKYITIIPLLFMAGSMNIQAEEGSTQIIKNTYSKVLIKPKDINKNIREQYQKTSKDMRRITPVMDSLQVSTRELYSAIDDFTKNPKDAKKLEKFYETQLNIIKSAKTNRVNVASIQASVNQARFNLEKAFVDGIEVEKENLKIAKMKFEEAKEVLIKMRESVKDMRSFQTLSKQEERDLFRRDREQLWKVKNMKNKFKSKTNLVIDYNEAQESAGQSYDICDQFLEEVSSALRGLEGMEAQVSASRIANEIMDTSPIKDITLNMNENMAVLEAVKGIPEAISKANQILANRSEPFIEQPISKRYKSNFDNWMDGQTQMPDLQDSL